MSADTIVSPTLRTIPRGVVVTRPEGEGRAPQVGPLGGLSVGAGRAGDGGALFLVVHERDGTSVVAMIGPGAIGWLAAEFNLAARRIWDGEFDQPETRQ